MLRETGCSETELYATELTKEEEQNPVSVIRQFFEGQELQEAKEKLAFWCQTALTDPVYYTAMDKADLVMLYKQVHKLLEAVFVVNEIRLLEAVN